MAYTLTIKHEASIGGSAFQASNAYSGGSNPNLDESIPGTSTDLLVVFALDVSAVAAIVIQSSTDMTLKTNSSSAPDNTIALKAGIPYIWEVTSAYNALLLTVDVTKLYMTNAGATAGTLRIEAITDPTPP